MPYTGINSEISKKFNSAFEEISAEYNFDLGDEFEIALCKTLRIYLPQRYGVCRGFLVTHNGETAGDDIIIYDQERIPTIRLLENGQFHQKQRIPIEAAYAYIEAKNTLYLDGDGGQSLNKAISQIEKIKKLTRPSTSSTELDSYTKLPFEAQHQDNWPLVRNPIYAGIFARNIKYSSSGKDDHLIFGVLNQRLKERDQKKYSQPDFIIAGNDLICLPSINGRIESPFYVNDISRLSAMPSKGKAIGTGLVSLSWAIDWIKLGRIYWPSIIANGLDLPLENNEYEP